MMSGRQDSNLRPPGPKPGAMTGLRYAPNYTTYLKNFLKRVQMYYYFSPAKHNY